VALEADFHTVVSAAKSGAEWALTDLYRDLYPRVLRYLRAVEAVDAEDLASETWLDVVGSLARFRGERAGIRALALTIARRRALDLRRARTRRKTDPRDPSEFVEMGATGNAEEDALSSLGAGWAIEVITSSLPREQADVILLRVIGGLDVTTVATIVGKRPGAVRVMQHRALRRLARTLERKGVTP
jgi:RNA polymerase sigma-70 factor (ECF subfamily)